jgi:subtilisin family serine protease
MFLNRVFYALTFTLISHAACAQINRYIVFFKDKAGTSFTVNNPSVYLSPRAIERRIKQNIQVTSLDFPVNPEYVQQLRAAGVDVFFKTRWMNGALIQCDASMISVIQSFGFVQAVEMVAPGKKLVGNNLRIASVVEKKSTTSSGTSTEAQLHLVGVDKMQKDGLRGEGRLIAIFDAGFPGVNTTEPFQHLMLDNQIDMNTSYDYVFNTTDVFQYDSHGTEVLSTVAAYSEASFTGAAYQANFQLYVTEDAATEYRIEEYNWLFAAERADSAGVDIISSSLGYHDFDDSSMDYKPSDMDGRTAVITRAAQFACDRGVLVVCSAGNEGAKTWHIITAPADCPDVLAIANVSAQGERSITSSIGPTADGRIKPDLAAMGTNVSVITPSGSIGSVSGTSLAAPLITGLAAGLWQHYPELTNKQLIEALKHTASQAAEPNNLLGYGIPNYIAASNYLAFIPQQNVFEVYPNPFIDTINIRPKNPEEIMTCRMQVITMQGQIIADQSVDFSWLNPSYAASFKNLSSGIYIIKIRLLNQTFIFKVVKS